MWYVWSGRPPLNNNFDNETVSFGLLIKLHSKKTCNVFRIRCIARVKTCNQTQLFCDFVFVVFVLLISFDDIEKAIKQLTVNGRNFLNWGCREKVIIIPNIRLVWRGTTTFHIINYFYTSIIIPRLLNWNNIGIITFSSLIFYVFINNDLIWLFILNKSLIFKKKTTNKMMGEIIFL